ncbi:SRPBCC family protein [Sandaracinus amylolyticus]|uniref:SRPBCC family protein n=1 Tax=Sandaracinus amylolyticus TaxID=927083 RepID=UPI001F38B750|nr:SRPBCC domain-containing protein [Sandaracinus amylolyticus]UJR82372.1 Hypothetical protein I5071_44370 [Sandaracinus amylolyticus]
MRSIADVTTGTVRAVVEIDAPPADVFAALTEPEQLALWWGGDLYRTYDWQMDLRPGGAWSVKTEGRQGHSEVRGEILEVDPPHALTLTWQASWDGFARTTIRYRLDAVSSGTRVTVVHDGFAGRPEQCENHAQGWDLVLGWLAAHAARR